MENTIAILDNVEDMLTDDMEVARFKRFLYIYGYEWEGVGEGSLKSCYMNEKMVAELKSRFIKWFHSHPDVMHKDSQNVAHLWFVLNAIGDIIGWKEDPLKWVPK